MRIRVKNRKQDYLILRMGVGYFRSLGYYSQSVMHVWGLHNGSQAHLGAGLFVPRGDVKGGWLKISHSATHNCERYSTPARAVV